MTSSLAAIVDNKPADHVFTGKLNEERGVGMVPPLWKDTPLTPATLAEDDWATGVALNAGVPYLTYGCLPPVSACSQSLMPRAWSN